MFAFLKRFFYGKKPEKEDLSESEEDLEEEKDLFEIIYDLQDRMDRIEQRFLRLQGREGGRPLGSKVNKGVPKDLNVHTENGQYIVYSDGTFKVK